MKDYKQRAEMILKRRDAALAVRRRRKKTLYRCSAYGVILCTAVTLSFGTISLWNKQNDNNVHNISSMMDTASTENAHARDTSKPRITDTTQLPYSAEIKVSETTVTSISRRTTSVSEYNVTDDPKTETEEIIEYNRNEDTDIPSPVEKAATSAPKNEVNSTTTTSVTTSNAAVTLPGYPEDQENTPDEPIEDIIEEQFQMNHLADTDDPIWVFSNITFEGQSYSSCRYLSGENKKRFYISWTEDTQLTAEHHSREVTVDVTIHGLRDREDEQEYIIVWFKNEDMYALYEADEIYDTAETELSTESVDNE